MFVDEDSKQKAAFTKEGPPITLFDNYNKNGGSHGLWSSNEDGVAPTGYKYQMLICNTAFYKGFFISGYYNNCLKTCGYWCEDRSSAYFRTSVAYGSSYYGVAFNENGFRWMSNRLISVGIR